MNSNVKRPATIILKIVAILLFAIMIVQSFQIRNDTNKVPVVADGHAVVFLGELTSNARVTEIETTEQYIYIAYANFGVVAVYDWDGTYQCSLAFNTDTNGVMMIRCYNEQLYVIDHGNNVLVFEGCELVKTYRYGSHDYTIGWFRIGDDPKVVIESGAIYDMEGNYVMDLPGRKGFLS